MLLQSASPPSELCCRHSNSCVQDVDSLTVRGRVQGGVLYVRPRKGHELVKKNFFKGGWLHSTATVHVSIAGHSKKSAQVDGSSPAFSDVIEFILGTSRLCNESQPCSCVHLLSLESACTYKTSAHVNKNGLIYSNKIRIHSW